MMVSAKFRNRAIVLGLALVVGSGCGFLKKKTEELSGVKMQFSGTVNRAGTTDPIKDAKVVFIKLVDADAISQLIEYKAIPDGKGGEAKRLRIKLDKIQPYVAAHESDTATTGADGKFAIEVQLNLYLVYTYGPGAAPGTGSQSYTVHFWGINPETGELTLDNLIGKDLKTTQANDKIQLAGGPVPPAPPAAGTPQPPAATTEVPDVPNVSPGNITPPTPTAFWTKITLTHRDGFIGTGGAAEIAAAPLKDGQPYLELTAELATAQAEPVFLVIQKGFDSSATPDCAAASAATVRVYPVAVNGNLVTYPLVPPGPYFRLYLAKGATQANEGEQPATPDNPSQTLTVGTQTCAAATPDRPFMATLSWDSMGDIDIHVYKFNAAKVAAATSEDAVGEALVDQANWTRRQGETLTLDVDNVYGYGPENNGEAKTVTDPDSYCYLVRVHYFSGSNPAVHADVDVTYIANENGLKVVKQVPTTTLLKEVGEWKTIGAFGPNTCSKLLSPPPPAAAAADVIPYPELSSCTNVQDSCDITGDSPGTYSASVALEKTTFAANETVKVTYQNMPGLSGDWITIVPKSLPDASWCSWQWSSGTQGTQFYGGLPPGTYEVRLYYNWTGYSGSSGGACEVIGRKEFVVQ